MNIKNEIRPTTHEKEKLAALVDEMQQTPYSNRSIVQLSQTTGINRLRLTYIFKQLTGYSIHQFLIKTRMENAKRLLQETEKPIKEIAGINGYHSTKHFSTAFKKHHGHTPFYYRKNRA